MRNIINHVPRHKRPEPTQEKSCVIDFNFFTGLYHSTLLGGEFSNCHGQGSTPFEALQSLKIRVYQLRSKS